MAKKKINCDIIEFDVIDKNDTEQDKPKCFGDLGSICDVILCGEYYDECKIATKKNVQKDKPIL